MPARAVKKKTSPARKPATSKRATVKFGRPGTAGKAEGEAAVRAWIKGVKREHRPIVERLDALITELVPGVKKAVKWSSPMYGLPGQGWIVSMASFKNHVNLVFFAGTSLVPPPPEGESHQMRRVSIREPPDFDEKQFRSWIQQAAKLKGWGTA